MGDAEKFKAIAQTLRDLDQELELTRMMLWLFLRATPRKDELLEHFEREVARFTANAPPEANQEQLVELRARAAMWIQALRTAAAPTGSRGDSGSGRPSP